MSQITNLLLYDHGLSDLSQVLSSLNNVTTTQISATGITRLGLMYKNKGMNIVPFMIKNSRFSKYTFFTDALISFITTHNIKIVDIISCKADTKLFQQEASKIYNDLGVIINYSVNKIGNVDGANWMLTCTNDPNISNVNGFDVAPIYFTNAIHQWEFDLDQLDLILYLQSLNAVKSISNGVGTTYTLIKNVTIDFSNNQYQSALVAGDIFNGRGKTITVKNVSLVGLFSIDNGVSSIDVYPIVKNLNVVSSSVWGGGVIVPSNKYFTINNCKFKGKKSSTPFDVTCNILTIGSGGIVGWGCSDFNVYKCKNYGTIYEWGGGIVGYGCQNFNVNKCTNFGKIIGNFAGGICGNMYLNYFTTPIYGISSTITNCRSYGQILGQGCGGIVGGFCGFVIGNGTSPASNQIIIDKCINKGNISGQQSGGICGAYCSYIGSFGDVVDGNTSSVTINNCKNFGSIGMECGGICGAYAGLIYFENMGSISTLLINKCISDGNSKQLGGCILGSYAGNFNNNFDYDSLTNNTINVTISGCKVKGDILQGSGGIVGSNSFYFIDTNISDNNVLNLLIQGCKIYGKCDKSSGQFLGNNCSGTTINITGNKYHKKEPAYINLSPTSCPVILTGNKNIH